MFRAAVVIILGYVGVCEALTTSDLDLGSLPDWLSGLIAVTGFFAVIVLTGFIGNGLLAIGLPIFLWKSWNWPFWGAALMSLPFWIVTYRLSPKPW